MDAHYLETIARGKNRFRGRQAMRTALMAAGVDAANGSGAVRAAPAPVGAPLSDEHHPDPDLDLALERMRTATVKLINGHPAAWKALCSRQRNATLFGGWGGHERGWEQLGPRYDWASARFAGGELVVEELARHVTSDLACTIQIERMRVRLTGMDAPVAISLRVTHLYGREETGWTLLHRHADHLTAIQPTEAVVDR